MGEYTSIYKTVTVIALSLPILYGVVYYMVEARYEAISLRLIHIETEINKGERFTRHDGQILMRSLDVHREVHRRDLDHIHDKIAKIRFDNATCKANVNSISQRFSRLEDKVYAMDFSPNQGWFRNAPYRGPQTPYEELYPARLKTRSFAN